MRHLPLEGKVFGHLTVIEYAARSKWLCECQCGKRIVVMTHHLNDGRRTSCGCQANDYLTSHQVRHVRRSAPLMKEIVEVMLRLNETTSAAIAKEMNVRTFSMTTWLYSMEEYGLVSSRQDRARVLWTLIVDINEAESIINEEWFNTQNDSRYQEKKSPAITEEDLQWMRHYQQRTKWRQQKAQLCL